jgi:hypothetical protein
MNRNAFLGIAERVAATFAFAFLAMWIPAALSIAGTGNWQGLLALSVLQKAAVAGLAAVLSLVKSLISTQVGNPNSGALLPNWLLKSAGAATWEAAPAPIVVPPVAAGAPPKTYVPVLPTGP